jgi:hypothetical protein
MLLITGHFCFLNWLKAGMLMKAKGLEIESRNVIDGKAFYWSFTGGFRGSDL